MPYSKYIVKSGIDSVSVLDLSSNTVLLSFWVIPQNLNSDYFSSWEGIQDDGRIKCEWVVSFYLDNNYDNTAKLYVTSVMSSEDYGLKQYYAQQGIDSGGDTEITSNSNKDQLANYSIRIIHFLSLMIEKNIFRFLYLILICCMSLTVQQHLKKAVI